MSPPRSVTSRRHPPRQLRLFFFFFNDTATTEIYTLSLHDALPICSHRSSCRPPAATREGPNRARPGSRRSEEHTSELQSQSNLVCRLLLEKKKRRTLRPRIHESCHARVGGPTDIVT